MYAEHIGVRALDAAAYSLRRLQRVLTDLENFVWRCRNRAQRRYRAKCSCAYCRQGVALGGL